MQAAEPEVPLTGGGSTPGVVRVGGTVRRPRKPDSGRIHRLLIHFERCGFGGAPRFLGVDARGRTVLSPGYSPPSDSCRRCARSARRGHAGPW
jgi:hypothetical protein